MGMSRDSVAAVRMEFAHSILIVKPFFEGDSIVCNDLMSLLNQMHADTDRDVVEAVEQCDNELLQLRKKLKELEKGYNLTDKERT